MLFSKLASYFDQLEKTSGRLEMTAILADLLKEADDDEVRPVCYLSLGRLGPLYESLEFNMAGKLMMRVLVRAYGVSEDDVRKDFGELGDLGDVAKALATRMSADPPKAGRSKADERGKLSVSEVFERLYQIAEREGAGSVEGKIVGMAELLENADPLSAKYIVRIPLGKMRLGFSDKTLIEALSWMETGDKGLKKEIEAAYHVFPDIGEIAVRFKEKGLKGLKGVKIKVGAPVLPARCQRVETPEEMIKKQGGKVIAEPKFDGERIQLHMDRESREDRGKQGELALEGPGKREFLVKMFTRNLEEVSEMFPELVTAADAEIKGEQVVLDGEVAGIDPQTSKFIPFQETIQRKRKYGVKEKAQEVPVKYFVFDILHKDGEDLLGLPFAKRREILEETIQSVKVSKCQSVKAIELTPQRSFTEPKKLEKFLEEEVERGSEGLVVKDPRAKYEAGARGFAWIKYKPEKDTIDAVVLGYYFGKGKRADFGIGAFLIGVYDSPEDGFKTLSKIGTGLTDEQWINLKSQISNLPPEGRAGKSQNCPKNVEVPKELTPDVWAKPEIVVEIQYDEISKSPLHSAGYALRFPRLVSYRDDKSATEATTVEEIRKMFEGQ
jgi:DNA ligase-1